jgi:hypothetical protein
MNKNYFLETFELATKDKKTQVRIDPEIAKALAIIAKAETIPGYVLIESICVDWIIRNRPNLVDSLQSVLNIAERNPIHQTLPVLIPEIVNQSDSPDKK